MWQTSQQVAAVTTALSRHAFALQLRASNLCDAGVGHINPLSRLRSLTLKMLPYINARKYEKNKRDEECMLIIHAAFAYVGNALGASTDERRIPETVRLLLRTKFW